MARKHKQSVELRYYDIPRGEHVLALMGERWRNTYGHNVSLMHFHNLWEVGCCHDGQGCIELADGSSLPYSGGSITFVPANVVHHTRSANPQQVDHWAFLFFDMATLAQQMHPKNPVATQALLGKLSHKPLVLRQEEHPSLAAIVKLIMTEMEARREQHSELTRYYAYSLMLEIARLHTWETVDAEGGQTALHQLRPALDHIRLHYREAIKIPSLAQCCSMSESHFRRLFETTVKMTPVAYINQVRIRQACRLLCDTDNTMEAVARAVGYASPATFHRNFTRLLGQSPYRWKRTADKNQATRTSYSILSREGWF